MFWYSAWNPSGACHRPSASCRSSCRSRWSTARRTRSSRSRLLANRAAAPPRASSHAVPVSGVYLLFYEANLSDQGVRTCRTPDRVLVRGPGCGRRAAPSPAGTSATATWPTTSTLRSVQRRPATRASCRLSAGICERRVACSAGASAPSSVVDQDQSERTRTRAVSRAASESRAAAAAAAAGCEMRPGQHLHQRSPATVPNSAIQNPSVRSCCTSRRRLAPSATRTAISRLAQSPARAAARRRWRRRWRGSGRRRRAARRRSADGREVAELFGRADGREQLDLTEFLLLLRPRTTLMPRRPQSAARPAATLWPSCRRPTSCTAAACRSCRSQASASDRAADRLRAPARTRRSIGHLPAGRPETPVYGPPLNMSVLPSTLGSPPRRRCQNP